MTQKVYNISIKDISGKPIELQQFEGKKMMIVNVASECGFTKQYAQLEELYRTFQDSLVILACPCNDFCVKSLALMQKLFPFVKKIMV